MKSTAVRAKVSMRGTKWGAWLRIALAVGLLAILAGRFGGGPFGAALARLNPWTVISAIGITAFTTACNTYRWRAVSAALGIPMQFKHGFVSYYRSQLINTTVPGGIVGDVDRGLRERRRSQTTNQSNSQSSGKSDSEPGGNPERHPGGHSASQPSSHPGGQLGGHSGSQPGNHSGNHSGHHSGHPALRAVAWERILGQLVQVLLAAIAVIAISSPLRDRIPSSALAVLVAATVAALAAVALLVGGSGRKISQRRIIRTISADWHRLRLAPHALATITVASLASTAGYLTIFMLAATSIGVSISLGALVPIALVILVLGSIPANLAGFGPREGAAAWVFALAGASAAQGISVSVLFGVLTLIGVLPGLAALLHRRREVRRG